MDSPDANHDHYTVMTGPTAWCLRVVIAVQTLGIWGRYVAATHEVESDIYGLLYFDWGWPESLAQCIDDWGVYLCLFAAALILLGGWKNRKQPQFEVAAQAVSITALLLIATWMFLLAVAHFLRGGLFAELSLGEHAVRYFGPICLVILLWQRESGHLVVSRLMILACGLTFAVHGYKAVCQYGAFTDLILFTDSNFVGANMEQSTAETLLWVIGILDIVVALLVVTRWNSVVLYMAIWGIITACSRMTALGWSAWPETLLRAANGGVPLALYLLPAVQTHTSKHNGNSQ